MEGIEKSENRGSQTVALALPEKEAQAVVNNLIWFGIFQACLT